MIERIPPDWRSVLAEPLAEPWFAEFCAFVALQRAEHTVYPPAADVFAAPHLTRFASVRAVILGQDPYHQPDLAHGLAFSVPPGVAPPGSLRNILAEWARDPGRPIPTDGSHWSHGHATACFSSTPSSRSVVVAPAATPTEAGST